MSCLISVMINWYASLNDWTQYFRQRTHANSKFMYKIDCNIQKLCFSESKIIDLINYKLLGFHRHFSFGTDFFSVL